MFWLGMVAGYFTFPVSIVLLAVFFGRKTVPEGSIPIIYGPGSGNYRAEQPPPLANSLTAGTSSTTTCEQKNTDTDEAS